MTSRDTLVRLVRCPKCEVVLPELTKLPVYECGGCGAILQAKHGKEFGKRVSADTCVRNPAQKHESEHNSEDTQSTSLNQKAFLTSTEACSSDLNYAREQIKSGDCNNEQFVSRIISNGLSYDKEEYSSEVGKNREVNGNNGRGSNFGYQSPQRPSNECFPSNTDNSSLNEQLEQPQKIVCHDTDHTRSRDTGEITEPAEYQSPQRPSNECFPSNTDNSSLNEQLEQPQKIVCHDTDHTRSRDTGEITERAENSIILKEDMVDTELSGRLRDVSKSPTIRSSHAYHGSVSSFDCWYDQVPERLRYLSKRTLFRPQRYAEFVGTKGKQTREGVSVNKNMRTNTNLEVQHQARKFTSRSSNMKRGLDAMGNVSWDQVEPPEPSRYSIEAQMQVNTRDSYRRGSPASYKNCSSSNYRHKEFLHSSSLYSSDKLDYLEHDRTELLRKVDELRDCLNRSYAQRGKTNGRFPTRGTQQEKHWGLYNNHEPPDQKALQGYGANYPQHPSEAYRPRKSIPHQCGVSQMPTLGKATNCRHHVDYSCSCCYPEDWQCPLQMPPPVYYNKGKCRAYSGHICFNPYSSSPSSPQRHMDSKFSIWGCNTQPWSHDQRHMDPKVDKLYHREKRQPMKRHCRPIAGGAPFIICNSCWKLLQLPADFIISNKRCHRLQCSACSEVLTFSLHNKNRIFPHSPNLIGPPPSEVDNSSDATTRKNLPSTSYGNVCPQAVSSAPPVPAHQSNAVNEMQPSSSYCVPMEERKKSVLKQRKEFN